MSACVSKPEAELAVVAVACLNTVNTCLHKWLAAAVAATQPSTRNRLPEESPNNPRWRRPSSPAPADSTNSNTLSSREATRGQKADTATPSTPWTAAATSSSTHRETESLSSPRRRRPLLLLLL